MKLNLNLSKLFNNNRFVQILSLIIAFIAWLVVSMTVDPMGSSVIQYVPINFDLSGTAPESLGLTIIDQERTTIDIKVEGRNDQIGLLGADDFIVTPVWANVTEAGETVVPLRVEKKNPADNNFKITGYIETVKITFDRINTKTFDLEAETSGVSAAENFKIGDVTVSPKTLTINGPQTELDQIERCAIVYKGDEQPLEETLITEGTLVFYDKSGNKVPSTQIPHVTYKDQSFSITIPVLMVKNFPVEVTFVNKGELDMSKLNYFLDYEVITVAGPKCVLDKRKSVTIGPIDLSKVDGRIMTLPVELNAGELNVDDVNEVMVTFDESTLAKKTLTISKDHIILYNTPSNYNVRLTSTSISDVKLVGNKEDIDLLSAQDLIARVDLLDIDESTLRVRVNILTTGNRFVWAVGEYYAYIEATKD